LKDLKMYKFFLPIIFLAVLTLLSGFFLFRINGVEIEKGQGCVEEGAVLQQLRGKNIFAVSSKREEEKITNSYKCVKNVTVQKKYPSTLKITVEVDRPVLKVGDKNIYLTENGFVLEGQGQQNLPTVFFDKEPEFTIGEKIDDDNIRYALDLILQIEKTDFVATSIRVLNPFVISVYNRENQAAIFTTEKDVKIQVDSLQLILSESKIDPSKITKIDLRFEKPTITFK